MAQVAGGGGDKKRNFPGAGPPRPPVPKTKVGGGSVTKVIGGRPKGTVSVRAKVTKPRAVPKAPVTQPRPQRKAGDLYNKPKKR